MACRCRFGAALFAACAFLFTGFAAGDVVHLEDGTTVEGEVEYSSDYVEVRSGGRTVTVPVGRVAKVVAGRGEAPTEESAAAESAGQGGSEQAEEASAPGQPSGGEWPIGRLMASREVRAAAAREHLAALESSGENTAEGDRASARGEATKDAAVWMNSYMRGEFEGMFTFYPDHTFRSHKGEKKPSYRWRSTPLGLLVCFYSGRWLFQPEGEQKLVGRYLGPDQSKRGLVRTLVPDSPEQCRRSIVALALAEIKMANPEAPSRRPGVGTGSPVRARRMQPRGQELLLQLCRVLPELSDVQWQGYVATLQGTPVVWSGWVEEVREVPSGGHRLLVDVDAPGKEGYHEVYFDVPADLKPELHKDQPIRFRGVVESVHKVVDFCVVGLKDAELIS